MFEPTDRGLRLQGLTRTDYYALDPETQKLISRGGQKAIDVDNVDTILKLMVAMVECDPSMKTRIANVIEAKEPKLEQYIRRTFQAYLQTDMKDGIRQFYFNILRRAKASQQQKEAQSTQPGIELSPQATQPTIRPSQRPKATAQDMIRSDARSIQNRRLDIAKMLSAIHNRPVGGVIRSEGDIIDAIIEIANENSQLGMTDSMVISACTRLIQEPNTIEFIKEALMTEHRQTLIDAIFPGP